MTTLSDPLRRRRSRLDGRPRLPFVVAVAAAALILLVAVDWHPAAADTEREVDEIAFTEALEEIDFIEEPGLDGEFDLEILEYGFGVITDPDGQEALSVAVRVRNPHDTAYLVGSLKIEAAEAIGAAEMVGLFNLGMLGPGEEAHLSGVIPGRRMDPSKLDGRELVVVADEISQVVLYGDRSEFAPGPWAERPSAAIVGIEELYAPQGVRVECRFESDEHLPEHWTVYVFFRDAEGRLVGGIPFARDDRYAQTTRVNGNSYLWLPRGTSTRYLDLGYDEIPAEADLDRIEIGFNR